MKSKIGKQMQIPILTFCLILFIGLTAITETEGDEDRKATNVKQSSASEPSIPVKAREFFEKGLMLNKGNPVFSPGILRQKESLYKKAIDIYSDYAEAWNNLGDVYEKLGEFDKALDAYDRAINIRATFAMAYFGKGDVFLRCKKYEEAINVYKAGLEYAYECDGRDVHLTEQRIKAAQDILSGVKNRDIITSDALIKTLGPEDACGNTRGVEKKKISQLPTVSFGEGTLPFSYGSAELQPQAKKQLDELADALKSEGLAKVCIVLEGHTDERGSVKFNLELSRKRAESARKYLIDIHKIDERRLSFKAYGKSLPIIPGAKTEAEHAANRRVEVSRLDSKIDSTIASDGVE